MSDTTTTLANMLKIYYDELYDKEQMAVNTSMYTQINKNKDVDGKQVEASFQVQRNNGIVTTAYTNSTEPTAQNRSYQNPIVTPQYIKAQGRFQQQLVSLSKNDKGSFAREIESMMTDLDTAINLQMCRQSFGDGSGKLAVLTANVTAADDATVYVHSTQYLELGTPVVVYRSGSLVDSTVIESIDPETKSFTCDLDVNLQSLDEIYLGTSTIDSYNGEITGLNGTIAKTGSYYGVSRDTYNVIRGATYGVGSGTANRPAAFSELNAMKVVNALMKRTRKTGADGEMTSYDKIFTDLESYTYYWQSLVGYRKFNDTTEFSGGVSKLTFDEKNVERDAYTPVEMAALGRFTAVESSGEFSANSTAGLADGDVVEVYRGNTIVGHITGIAVSDACTFTGTFSASDSGAIASGDLFYLDNSDSDGTSDNSAALVYHNMYYVNFNTFEWMIWQDITNYNDRLNNFEFEKVSGSTEYLYNLNGLLNLFCSSPNKNGRYRFTLPQSYDSQLTM